MLCSCLYISLFVIVFILVIAYVIMRGLCYDLFCILMPYGGLMGQWIVHVMYVYVYMYVRTEIVLG
jgi:hypothetical protein